MNRAPNHPSSPPRGGLSRWGGVVRRLFAVLGVAAVVFVACVVRSQLEPLPRDAQLQGSFTVDTALPGQTSPEKWRNPLWSSWQGADANAGTLRLGLFPAPKKLKLAVAGYPNTPGNELYLHMPWIGIKLPLTTPDAGSQWQMREFELPLGWQGWQVELVAVDGATGEKGWLGVSSLLEPDDGRRMATGVGAALTAWAANGAIYGLLFLAALSVLSYTCGPASWLLPVYRPLAAIGIVAAGGYLAFWAYFASPVWGRGFSVGVLVAAAVGWVVWGVDLSGATRSENGDSDPVPGATTNAGGGEPGRGRAPVMRLFLLPGLIGVLYIALLYLFTEPRGFYDLAAQRFVEDLPGDNRLPHDVAAVLYNGGSLKPFGGDWQSSDRPPLQSGLLLLAWPVTSALQIEPVLASGTAGVWMQLTWVAAALVLFRGLGVSRRRATAWIVLLAGTGFFLFHTMYTWPKLLTGALACGAFALWLQPRAARGQEGRLVGGAALAALAWLAHGGAAFSLAVAGGLALWRWRRLGWRPWLGAAAAFLLLVAPWAAYQKFYDPPGNRLLKWHLAGQVDKDDRGVIEALKANYARLGWRGAVDAKLANLRLQFKGDWRPLVTSAAVHTAPAATKERRNNEFYHTARALTWWGLLGAPALLLIAAWPGLRRRGPVNARALGLLALWTGATLVLWCVALFGAGQAVIHQGSFAVMLGLFVLLSAALAKVDARLVVLVAVAQLVAFGGTWLARSSKISEPLSREAAWVAGLASIALVALAFRSVRRARRTAV